MQKTIIVTTAEFIKTVRWKQAAVMPTSVAVGKEPNVPAKKKSQVSKKNCLKAAEKKIVKPMTRKSVIFLGKYPYVQSKLLIEWIKYQGKRK
jgi:hypothetical protein